MKNLILTSLFVLYTAAAHTQTVHTANINNAPAWQASHAYSTGDEVQTVGGSGLAGTRGYKLISGACTSGLSGSPSGTGTSIADGACTWKYLSDIDYTSIALWLQNGIPQVTPIPAWQTSTAYNKYDMVYTTNNSPAQAYYATNAGTSCSMGAGPRGSRAIFSDCGVTWRWMRSLAYPITTGEAISVMDGTYIGYVYKGAEYVDQGNYVTNSALPYYGRAYLNIAYHNQPTCRGECLPLNYYLPSLQSNQIILTAAPGESIFDNPTAPLTYDPSKGVAIRCTSAIGSSAACISISDWNVTVERMQIKSAESGVNFWSHGVFYDDLIDADGDGLYLDDMVTVANNVVYAGNVGVTIKYHDTLINNTIFGKTGAVIGILQNFHPSYSGAPVMTNTAVMGFTYCAGYSTHVPPDAPGFENDAPPSDYNATDVGSGGIQKGTIGITWTRRDSPVASPATSMPCPGFHSHYNVPFTAATFTNTTNGSYDARLVKGSALIGAGAVAIDETMNVSTSSAAWPDNATLKINGSPGNWCTPSPGPYSKYFTACGNPFVGIRGTGIPSDSRVITIGVEGRGPTPLPSSIMLSYGCTGCSATEEITLSYAPIQSADIFGVSRRSRFDIGAVQGPTGNVGGNRFFIK